MICPRCSHIFKFREIPLEERRMKALYSEFLCPNCSILLKPSSLQVTLISIAIGLFSVSGIGLAAKIIGGFKFSNYLLILSVVVSIIIYALSIRYQEAIVVREDT
jgi:hypothetical protein